MKIGIIVAMSVEYAQLAKLMETPRHEHAGGLDFTVGQIDRHEVVLLQCGIGKVNAALGTTLLTEHYRPDCIISTGCAGGIDERLRVMDVVVSSQLVYHDVDCGAGLGCEKGQVQGLPLRFAAAPRLVEAATAIKGPVRIHAGLICTGDQFITSHTELAHIKADFPDGLAVDMESAAIAQVCHVLKVPFVSFRIISDTPGADGHQQQYENFWTEMADRSFGVTRQFLLQIG
ncbi:MAG: 5'-methylthioadenosine/adenosylhomocysteine nucleosidase [Bacteroidaceae bacterium]|nr:5'-methylthioadenosine/adenosylhomocysteine nucleosidase [Bacteroidaceae bacterium]